MGRIHIKHGPKFRIIGFLKYHGDEWLSTDAISKRTGMAMSTTKRICKDLFREGKIDREPEPCDERCFQYRVRGGE